MMSWARIQRGSPRFILVDRQWRAQVCRFDTLDTLAPHEDVVARLSRRDDARITDAK